MYKELKLKIIQLFGPVEEEAFERAAALVLTSKPSALAKKITELLCTCDKPLENCCAAATVSALWKRQLPQQVRTAVAGMSLKENFENVLQKADDAYASLKEPARAVNYVAAAVQPAPLAGAAAAAQPDDQPAEVAAFGRARRGGQGRGQGRGQSRGRGGGQQRQGQRPGQQQQQPQQQQAGRGRAKRHPDNPPENSCKIHWQWGRSAYFCADIDNCPWANVIAPQRPNYN